MAEAKRKKISFEERMARIAAEVSANADKQIAAEKQAASKPKAQETPPAKKPAFSIFNLKDIFKNKKKKLDAAGKK